jgi:hypothetical protein
MSDKLDPQRTVLYRALANYYAEKLGVSQEELALTANIDVNRFLAFTSGTTDEMTLSERESFCSMTRSFVEAERQEVAEAKWYRRPIPRTAEDVASEVIAQGGKP